MWKNQIIDLGNIKPNSSNKIEFEYLGNKNIVAVTPGCGCTTSIFNNNIITATYKASEIPKYLNKNEMDIEKSIAVKFEDGSKDFLIIKARIVNEK